MAGPAKSKTVNTRTSDNFGVKLVRGPFLKLDPHPQSVDELSELGSVVKKLTGPLAADLFCGAGGLSLGLAEAGYNVVVGIDHDDFALETHRANHPGLSASMDLGDDEVVEELGQALAKLKIDLLAGGPPCQPFSRAGRSMMRELVRTGRRPKHDGRRDLWQSFLRIASIVQPPAILMENVPDMALDRGMWILRSMVDELEELGYSVEERVVATWDYGVPQMRQRLILVALKSGRFGWPEPTAQTNLRAAISDLPVVEGGWRPDNGDEEDVVASGWAEYDCHETRSRFQREMRAELPKAHLSRIYDHITRPVREDDLRAFEQMDSTTKYSDIDPELRRYRSDIFDDKYKRLDWDGLSRTITAHIAKDGYWYIHPEQHRTLTVREAARIQTFPDHVRFAGPPSAAFRQIGNAVPPRLGTVLGEAILRSLDEGADPGPSTAETSRRLAKWFYGRKTLAIPWLEAETRWQVIQADILWQRLSKKEIRSAWEALSELKTPADTLEPANKAVLRMMASARDRLDRFDTLVNVAEWLVDDADVETMSATELDSVSGITKATSDLAVRVVPADGDDPDDDPVIVTQGVLRVASRFQGTNVENRNRYSDGRLAIAGMIGGDDSSHPAHLALLEIAANICVAGQPDCAHCPLVETCHTASVGTWQRKLA